MWIQEARALLGKCACVCKQHRPINEFAEHVGAHTATSVYMCMHDFAWANSGRSVLLPHLDSAG